MIRVTYLELKFDCCLDPSESETDKSLKEKELESLGPLFYQKDQRKFTDYILEIEKAVIAEA